MRLNFSGLVALVALPATLLATAPTLAADITLDSAVLATGAKGRITFKTVTLTDCNLSQAEAASLFSGALPREEAGALLERMTAKTLKIPESRNFRRKRRPVHAARYCSREYRQRRRR